MDIQATTSVLLLAFLGAALMGAIAHKTHFCTMGAVSDWINMGNTARLGSWYLSIAVAIIGVLGLQLAFDISLESTLPPYTTANFAWLRYILGGLMFGIGMTLAGGCGSKTLINIGGGSLRSVLVLLIAAIMAYAMTKTSFYENVFHSWINATTIDLKALQINNQSLTAIIGKVTGLETDKTLHTIIALLIAAGFAYIAFRSKQFRKHPALIFAGLSIGSIIVAGWYISSGPTGQAAIEAVEWLDQRPVGVGAQSYTFINPMGELLTYAMSPRNTLLITYGLVALVGMILGAFVSAILTGSFRISGFSSKRDLVKHVVGGFLMGTGGILAMGCTIGQGITGVSTLAAGSCLALFSIISGSALTIKTNYYRIMCEDEAGATFTACLISALVDFKLLPRSMKKLDA